MDDRPQPQSQPLQNPRYFTNIPSKDHVPQFPDQLQTHKNGSSFSFSTFKKLLVVACMLPLSFAYFTLASLSLAAALAGLVITVPLLVLISPVLVPAVLVIGLAVTGFLSSGAVGLAAVTVLFWVYHYIQMTI